MNFPRKHLLACAVLMAAAESQASTGSAPVTAAPMFDLDDIVTVDTAEVELIHPKSGVPLGMFITIFGPEHPKRKALELDRARKIRLEMRATGKMPVTDPAEDEEEAVESLVTSTSAFHDLAGGRPVLVNGKPVQLEDARAFYTDSRRRWAAEQVLRALRDSTRFIRSSAKA